MNDFINPLLDDCFKTVFATRRNIANLAGFLKAALDLRPDELDKLTLMDPFLKRWSRRNKAGILDVRVQTTSKMEIDVEVQISKSPAMAKRILYYLSKMIWDQLKPGDDYGLLRPVIGVIICDHRMLEEAGYAHSYTLRERDSGNDEFTDMIKVHILELPKVPGEPDGTPVWPWLKYFKCRNVKEFEMLKKEHPEISGAVTELRLHKASFRDRWRRTLELFEKERRDALMWENAARREGREKGLAEGREEGRVEGLTEGREEGRAEGREEGREEGERKKSEEIARKLKAQNFSAAKIAELTGLSPGEVEGL